MHVLPEAALRRKPDATPAAIGTDNLHDDLDHDHASRGAREIRRRTHWSEARCIAVAEAWGFGVVEV